MQLLKALIQIGNMFGLQLWCSWSFGILEILFIIM